LPAARRWRQHCRRGWSCWSWSSLQLASERG